MSYREKKFTATSVKVFSTSEAFVRRATVTYPGTTTTLYAQLHDASSLSGSEVPIVSKLVNVQGVPVELTEGERNLTVGCTVALSSTQATYTAAAEEATFAVEISPTRTAGVLTDVEIAAPTAPVFKFLFDGDLTDELGGNALVKSGGTDLFIPSPRGGRAFRASVEHAEHAANEATLEITGALTISTWIRFTAMPNAVWLTFGNGASSAAADNHLYTISTTTAGACIWSQENGSGTNSADTSLPVLAIDEWVQLTYTRPTAATSVKQYLNGYLSDTSAAITAPTGGTAGVLTVGGTEGSVDSPVDIAALTIWNVELTAAQVLDHTKSERRLP